MPIIRKVLIANRGEIACRIMRTCRSMGIATVAVFSTVDTAARHVCEADEAIHIGDNPATASYLNIPALIEAAQRSGADAIHPGYGFLAENADFAAACLEAGLIFIGPTPEAIRRMGSKREAKLLMQAAGVPTVPGYQGEDQSDETLINAAGKVGYPLMVKAAAGGGGKGMRVVSEPDAMPEALAAARREALSAFGDDTLILERVIAPTRHVEFQIFGDQHGQIIHLGERECSIQRRHQKIIEETPSTALTPELRQRMGEAAITVGRQIDYVNAGTVEFILDEAGDFYFLEVNTRLQVEHPVTEYVTGLDLVRWQIEIAEDRPLPLKQEEVHFSGHAIECRVYAEDPANNFLPATGDILLWREPAGDGARVDAGIVSGGAVSIYYDPMLAKIITCGADRAEALRRMDRALKQTTLLGLRNNIAFLRRVLFHPEHVAGRLSTRFIEQHLAGQQAETAASTPVILAAALARELAGPARSYWRNNPNAPMRSRFRTESSEELEVCLAPRKDGAFQATLQHTGAEITHHITPLEVAAPDLRFSLDGHVLRAVVVEAPQHRYWVQIDGITCMLTWLSPLPEPGERREGQGSLRAPMPGNVRAVLAVVGQPVRKGETLMLLEAMKMEHSIRAPYDGIVTVVAHQVGAMVQADAVLLEIAPADEPAS
ncbi:MAG TPA: acetyl-CoA carboxylase biotin carboxylase subunit [Ktedonobacterales bacterium]|jgi:acetyl-CoA carboxylase biotin carboxylase subunit